MIIDSNSKVLDAINILNAGLYFTYDIETNSLNPRKGQIIGFGCCNSDTMETFYIILKKWENGQLIDVVTTEAALPIIQALQSKRLITWNGSFDCRFTHHYFGVDLTKALYHDGMIAAHTISENKFSYALKTLAAEEFGLDSKDAQADMLASIKANGGTEKQYFMADAYKMATYGIQDNKLTAMFFIKQRKELQRRGLWSFFQEEPMELYRWVTIQMEMKGIPVDVPYIQETKAQLQAELTRLEREIQEVIAPNLDLFNEWFMAKEYPPALSGAFLDTVASLIAPPDWPRTKAGGFTFSEAQFKKKPHFLEHDLWSYKNKTKRMPTELVKQVQAQMHADSGQSYAFNILSKDHLKRLFFTKLKEKPLSTTELGSPQVDDDFLELMAKKYEWVSKLRTYNKLTKIMGTYVDRILDAQEDGMFYPQYHQHRTTSGRYSGDLQQLPRIKTLEDENDPIFLEYNNRIRNFFISGPGHKLIDADYSSLEVVVFADDAQDEALMNIIRQKTDFYSQMAILVYKMHEYSADKKADNFLKKHKPELRQKAKAFSLGIRYGLDAFKLHHDLSISMGEAESIVKAYFAALPQLAVRMKELKQQALTKGFVVSKAGRVRNFPGLVEKYKKYGDMLLDSLELWKEYNETPAQYTQMKKIAREVRGDINNAYNFPIQSFAASIVSRASIALAKHLELSGLSSYICMSTHDELCLRSPDAEVALVTEPMQRIMETTTLLSVPLEAEPIIGTRYGDVK
jgi:DNA polymerase I-like protein with 3'-5' exonuclease and polymerase domains